MPQYNQDPRYSPPATGRVPVPETPIGYPQPGAYPVSGVPVTGVPVTGAPVTAPPPPPKRRLDLGWLIGGVSGTLAILLAVAATLVSIGVFGHRSAPAGSAPSGDDKEKSEYAFVADLCSKLDLSALEDFAPAKDGIEQIEEEPEKEGQSYSACEASFGKMDTRTWGVLNASASRWKTETEAEQDAESVRKPGSMWSDMAMSDLSGDWDYGNIAKKFHPSTGATQVYVLIQDERFTAIAHATFTTLDGELDEKALQEATVATAIGILELSRA